MVETELRGSVPSAYRSSITAVPASVLNYRAIDLVFYGVDTVADIQLNGSPLGSTDNMFVRYKYDVRGLLKVSDESRPSSCWPRNSIVTSLDTI